jgi:hypothetical protein
MGFFVTSFSFVLLSTSLCDSLIQRILTDTFFNVITIMVNYTSLLLFEILVGKRRVIRNRYHIKLMSCCMMKVVAGTRIKTKALLNAAASFCCIALLILSSEGLIIGNDCTSDLSVQ